MPQEMVLTSFSVISSECFFYFRTDFGMDLISVYHLSPNVTGLNRHVRGFDEIISGVLGLLTSAYVLHGQQHTAANFEVVTFLNGCENVIITWKLNHFTAGPARSIPLLLWEKKSRKIILKKTKQEKSQIRKIRPETKAPVSTVILG